MSAAARPDMRLEAVHGGAAFVLDPVSVTIGLARRGDDRRTDQGACFDRDRAGFQLGGGHSRTARGGTARGRALRGRLAVREAANATKRCSIIERFGELDVREFIPARQQQVSLAPRDLSRYVVGRPCDGYP